ncbi:hypothetical protein L218DRAFT_966684 [Marasmius fiardii PR-910]|nr:hypothetical protein L218DRAFT_966684 [Marasmius fiardii PR-910]
MSSSSKNSVHPTVVMLDQVSLDLHYIHPRLQKLLKSEKLQAGAQKAFDGMKEHLERIAIISGHSWMLPSVEAERLSKDPKCDISSPLLIIVINFKSNDCSKLAIEPDLVERVRRMEQKSKHAQVSHCLRLTTVTISSEI